MDAEIINNKITRILFKQPVDMSDNFDIITHSKNSTTVNTERRIRFMEVYISMDVFKTTGITYSEFKKMTPIEHELFMNTLGYKIDIKNIDIEDETSILDNNITDHSELFLT